MGRARRRSPAARLGGAGTVLGLADAHADTGTGEFTEMERSLAEAGTALRAVAPPPLSRLRHLRHAGVLSSAIAPYSQRRSFRLIA